jgi:hypothetical protein
VEAATHPHRQVDLDECSVAIAISEHAEPWDDESVEQLVRDLANFGIQLDAKRARPRAPLEPLADDARRTQFFALIDRVLDTLTSSPSARRRSRVCRGPRNSEDD